MNLHSLSEVSIVVPTYNGGRSIHLLLDAVARQTVKNFEIIVVVDGSTDDTPAVLNRYKATIPGLRFLIQKNGGRSVARNNGAREAIADVIVFYDDDVIPDIDSVERHIAFHRNNFGILCGNPVESYSRQKTDVQNYKAWLTAQWTAKYSSNLNIIESKQVFFTACNCSISRTVFWQLGGFNEELRDAEDYDLARRSLKQNIPVYYDKMNRAIHHDNITCMSYISRLREYARAHRQLHLDRVTAKPEYGPTRILKSLVYKGFAFAFWVRLVDSGILVFLLPKLLRYRLYSMIIQSLAYDHNNVRL